MEWYKVNKFTHEIDLYPYVSSETKNFVTISTGKKGKMIQKESNCYKLFNNYADAVKWLLEKLDGEIVTFKRQVLDMECKKKQLLKIFLAFNPA